MAAEWSSLQKTVSELESSATIGLTVVGPAVERWSHNGDRAFRTASVVKIPLMVEVYRGIDRGDRAFDDRFCVAPEDKTPGSGVLLHLHDGIEVSLNDLIYLMISISDNTATNMLIDMAGMDAVNATMGELGMGDSNLGRKMLGRPAVEGEIENRGTPDDYATIVQTILHGTAASAASCKAMVEMLEKQQNGRRIARLLPERADVRWGSKTGSITGVTNDVGFVEIGGRTTIVSAFCEGFPDHYAGEEAIGRVTHAALQCLGIL